MRRLRCLFRHHLCQPESSGGTGGCVRDVVLTCGRSPVLREGSKIRAPVGAVATSVGPVATCPSMVVVMARECWRLLKIWLLRGTEAEVRPFGAGDASCGRAAGVPAGPPRLALPPYLSETAPGPGRFTNVAVCPRRSHHLMAPRDMNRPARAQPLLAARTVRNS
jgi:hypothetical protein